MSNHHPAAPGVYTLHNQNIIINTKKLTLTPYCYLCPSRTVSYSLPFITVTVLKNTNQLFCIRSLSVRWSDVTPGLSLGHGTSALPLGVVCTSLDASPPKAPGLAGSHHQRCTLNAWFFPYQVTMFPLVISNCLTWRYLDIIQIPCFSVCTCPLVFTSLNDSRGQQFLQWCLPNGSLPIPLSLYFIRWAAPSHHLFICLIIYLY